MLTTGDILSKRYLIQAELGSGGMAVVYRAVDLHTGGTVAIKMPHAYLLRDDFFIQRLKREAEIAVHLHSSRIARVTDIGEHQGAPYLVLEFVPGESLAAVLVRQGALPPLEALAIGLDVARAMQTAHEHGVVHRDLKCQNIYLTPAGDVKVLDFGIARQEGLTNITTASVFLGTPEYAAPERAEGAGDIRSDIYSLGVVLYETLTGALPFMGSTPWKMMELHLTASPPRLPDTVPAVARTVVERCLAKDPGDRYQTPAELAVALRRAIRMLDRDEANEAPLPHPIEAPTSEPVADVPLIGARAPDSDTPSADTTVPVVSAASHARSDFETSGARGFADALSEERAVSSADTAAPALSPAVPAASHARSEHRRGRRRFVIAATAGCIGLLLMGGTIAASITAVKRANSSNVIFSEDFNDPEHPKLATTSPAPHLYTLDYMDSEYVIRKLSTSMVSWHAALVGADIDTSDASVAVDVRLIGEADQRWVALACRHHNDAGAYQLRVDPTAGTFQLAAVRNSDGHVTPLAEGPASAIRRDNGTNRIQLGCRGDTLRARINGTQVAMVHDQTYEQGAFWIGVGTYVDWISAPVEARFDNLAIVQE